MKTQVRTTFYPDPEVQKALSKARPKKVSNRINELIRKGLGTERDEQTKNAYLKHAQELSKTGPRKVGKDGVSTTMLMASGLFAPDDEPEGWF